MGGFAMLNITPENISSLFKKVAMIHPEARKKKITRLDSIIAVLEEKLEKGIAAWRVYSLVKNFPRYVERAVLTRIYLEGNPEGYSKRDLDHYLSEFSGLISIHYYAKVMNSTIRQEKPAWIDLAIQKLIEKGWQIQVKKYRQTVFGDENDGIEEISYWLCIPDPRLPAKTE
jgi:hypothetical protein